MTKAQNFTIIWMKSFFEVLDILIILTALIRVAALLRKNKTVKTNEKFMAFHLLFLTLKIILPFIITDTNLKWIDVTSESFSAYL